MNLSKIIHYRHDELDEVRKKYDINTDAVRYFNSEVLWSGEDETKPFRDDISRKVLKDMGWLHYKSEDDMYCLQYDDGTPLCITQLPDRLKEALVLIRNSADGVYTSIHYIDDKLMAYLNEQKYADYLIAYDDGDQYESLCDKKALKIMLQNVSFRYKNAAVKCDVSYPYSFPECDTNRIISHIKMLRLNNITGNHMPVLCVDYMKDGSVTVREKTPQKYDAMDSVILSLQRNDKKYNQHLEKTFFMVVDAEYNTGRGIGRKADKKQKSEEISHIIADIDKYVWFGGYRYADYFELYDKDVTLMEYARIMPGIIDRLDDE